MDKAVKKLAKKYIKKGMEKREAVDKAISILSKPSFWVEMAQVFDITKDDFAQMILEDL